MTSQSNAMLGAQTFIFMYSNPGLSIQASLTPGSLDILFCKSSVGQRATDVLFPYDDT